MDPTLRIVTLPLFVALIVAEVLWYRRQKKTYAWKESLASLGVAAGHSAAGLALGFVSLGAAQWVYAHRLATIELTSAWPVLGLFVGMEFLYYWFHRLSHEVRWLWASHAVHHTPTNLNLTAAYRLGWTGVLSGAFMFFLPLAWLGYQPKTIFVALGLNLTYQFWLHTELVPKLGWLENVFNTPSHHRVHHASNAEYLDRNYGGVLIVFDRLFGTLAVEDPATPLRYGLTKPVETNNPVKIAFHEWVAIAKDLRRARSPRELAGYTLGSPAWTPEGAPTPRPETVNPAPSAPSQVSTPA